MKTGMFKYSLLAATMAFSGLTMAANTSTTLLVKGQVSTGTCTATLDTPNIDLGTISTDKQPATGSYAAITFNSAKRFSLLVNCTSPLKYEISLTDNRADSAIPASETSENYEGRVFGLGKASDGTTNIGGYELYVEYYYESGTKKASITRLPEDGSPWVSSTQGVTLTPINNALGFTNNRMYQAMAEPGTLEPMASQAAEFQYRIAAFISSGLGSITDQENVDGNMTFNIDYL